MILGDNSKVFITAVPLLIKTDSTKHKISIGKTTELTSHRGPLEDATIKHLKLFVS
jgi:hypothetical protein